MRKKPTVADLRALKGRGQRTMLRVMTLEEAAAAEAAGIDIVSVPDHLVTHPDYRKVAPTLFSMTGVTHLEAGTRDDYLRWACKVMNAGADAVYCSGSLATVEHVAREHIPVVGHVGLVPSRATWTGGFKAVGKTAASALKVWRDMVALEEAGAFAVELEVVPARVGTELSRRSGLVTFGMGAGSGADAQYLFAEDVLGCTRGHRPRHAKVYRDFAGEYARLQAERVAAFGEFVADVRAGRYPAPAHDVAVDEAEFAAFLEEMGNV